MGSCITANRQGEGLETSSQYMWFRYNEPTTARGHGFAGAHERAYGGVKGVTEVRSVFSLTVDFVLASCLRYDLRSMVF